MGRSFEVRKASMAKTAAQKSKVYSKYGKQIYVAAKNGGADPVANATLKALIDKAKRDQVPSHVIEKNIEKAAGVGGEDYSPARYEGFGPGGCAVIVDCLTDNPNRTITDVRNCFTKTGGKMGAQGSVIHSFDHLAVFLFPGDNEEQILETLMGAEVDVVDLECEDGKITLFAPATEFGKAKAAISEAWPELEMEAEEISYIPQQESPVSDEDLPMFDKFLDMLNDCEDVQDVYHNAQRPPASDA